MQAILFDKFILVMKVIIKIFCLFFSSSKLHNSHLFSCYLVYYVRASTPASTNLLVKITKKNHFFFIFFYFCSNFSKYLHQHSHFSYFTLTIQFKYYFQIVLYSFSNNHIFEYLSFINDNIFKFFFFF